MLANDGQWVMMTSGLDTVFKLVAFTEVNYI